MTDLLQTLLQGGAGTSPAFPPNSRYHGLPLAKLETASGETYVYVRRRKIPPPDAFFLLQEHTVTEGERPDTVAARYLGDPEQFWRICDANAVLQPDELTDTPGQKIRITLPEGVPGYNNA